VYDGAISSSCLAAAWPLAAQAQQPERVQRISLVKKAAN